MLGLFFFGEFLLHILRWFLFSFFHLGSFSYTSRAGFIFIWRVSLTHPVPASFLIWGDSLTHPLLDLFLSGEFLLHIPCWLYFCVGSFFYMSHAFCFAFFFFFAFFFYLEVSLPHPMLASFLSGEFLLHIPCWFHFFIWGVSLTHPVLASFLISGVSLTHPLLALFFTWGVSLTHPVLSWFLWNAFLLHILCCLRFLLFVCFLSGEFLLHIPRWLFFFFFNFILGWFSYISRTVFIFIWGLSLKHPVPASFLCGEFLIHIPCWLFLCGEFLLQIPCCLHFYLGSFSYTSRAVLIFMQGVFSYTSRAGFLCILRRQSSPIYGVAERTEPKRR